MSFRRIALKVVLGLAIVAAFAPLASSAGQHTTTTWHKFHAHVDAYADPYSCFLSEWNSPHAMCIGWSNNGNNGTANGFHGQVRVDWCPVAGCNDQYIKARAQHFHAPHGYTRWMWLCRSPSAYGHCDNWLLGAVKMPNGPFAVVEGHIDGHAVTPTSNDESKVEHQGGPLFLYVGFHGQSSVRHGAGHITANGYVFGFRGWLNY
jgi:hypothetical protein